MDPFVSFTWYLSFTASYFNYYIAMVDPGQINIPITKAGAVQMKKPADVKVQKLGMWEFLIYLWENWIKFFFNSILDYTKTVLLYPKYTKKAQYYIFLVAPICLYLFWWSILLHMYHSIFWKSAKYIF